MSLIAIGGHTRNVGKTSLMAGLISALRERNWTAVKISQYGHGVCSVNGKTCNCAVDEHPWAITQVYDREGDSDTSRFLAAGAAKGVWVRAKQGRLEEAMPAFRQRIAADENVIIESNSVIGFLQPDVYLTVLDFAVADFKESARRYLERADAVVLHHPGANGHNEPAWSQVSRAHLADKKIFYITPPPYATPEIVEFVRQKIGPVHAQV
jgi:molybdopterin-guanine dinucleotide biosynthesis protein